jgi:hypothetical protein
VPSRPNWSSRHVAYVLLAVSLAAASAFSAVGRITSDFANYWVPARVAAGGGELARIYERAVFDEASRQQGIHALGSFVPHPPANALLLMPLARFEAATAKTLWTAVLALAYVASLALLHGVIPLGVAPLAVVAAVPAFAVGNALGYGQPYPLLLLLLCASLRAAAGGRPLLAGALLAPVLVLKLYALPFLAAFAWQRRWKAAAALGGGAVALTILSCVVLGTGLHRAYVREVLPASLEGRIQDPYSTVWQSASSLSRRLFEREPDLNPEPALDRPHAARFLARALPAGLTVIAVLAAAAAPTPPLQWSILVCGALAAAPLTASYHFVLLVLPMAVALGDRARGPRSAWAVVALSAFAASPLPHHFAGWAHGAGNLLAYPRLVAMVALLAVVSARFWSWRRLTLSAAAAVAAGLSAPPPAPAGDWNRLGLGGYLQASPIDCAGRIAWLGIEDGAYVVRATDGTRLVVSVPPQEPGCFSGRVAVTVPTREARLSPDGEWRLAPVWRAGSWDVDAVSTRDGRAVRVTSDPANEIEPSWSEDGRQVLFASDRGRGLGSTAAYGVAFGGRESPARSATASSR